MLKFQLAEPTDVTAIIDLLERARQHKIDNGEVAPWSIVRRSRVENGIADGQVYVVSGPSHETPAGTVQIQQSDEEVWGDDATPALYVHRLAVEPAMQGKGIGGEIIDWATDEASKANADYLRLDVHVGCTQLRDWYEKRDFISCGEVMPASYTRPSMRYQKRLQS